MTACRGTDLGQTGEKSGTPVYSARLQDQKALGVAVQDALRTTGQGSVGTQQSSTQKRRNRWGSVSTSFILAVRTGFEPATFCVTGRYANRYTTRPHQATDSGSGIELSGPANTCQAVAARPLCTGAGAAPGRICQD